MKVIVSTMFAIIGYLGGTISGIWAIVEFILYLVKDREFNWWSVWIVLICAVFTILSMTLSVVYTIKKERPKPSDRTKSTFQQRLEEMAKNRKNN